MTRWNSLQILGPSRHAGEVEDGGDVRGNSVFRFEADGFKFASIVAVQTIGRSPLPAAHGPGRSEPLPDFRDHNPLEAGWSERMLLAYAVASFPRRRRPGTLPMRRVSALFGIVMAVLGIASPSGQKADGQRGQVPPGAARATPAPPARWWKDRTVAATVGLTVPQTERINTVFDQFLKPQRERWAALLQIERELDELLREAHPDERLVIDRLTALENRRSEMNRSRLIMLFHVQQVLSPSQRSKLQELGWSVSSATTEQHAKTTR